MRYTCALAKKTKVWDGDKLDLSWFQWVVCWEVHVGVLKIA